MLLVKTLTIIFLVEILSYEIGGLHAYYILFYFIVIVLALLAYYFNKKKLKKDTTTRINIEQLKCEQKLHIYITKDSRDTASIKYTTGGIYIFISKKLYETLTLAELEVIIQHELGHHYYRYISLLGNIIMWILVIFLPIAMYNFYLSTSTILMTYGVFIIYSFLSFFFYSNFRKLIELLADKQSVKHTSKHRFVKALIKAAKVYNKDKPSHKLYNLFFEFHPSIKMRCKIVYWYAN